MSLDPGRTLAEVLDLIDAQLAEIDAFDLAGEGAALPTGPELPAEVHADARDRARAEALLADLRAAEAKVIGLRRRVAGEIAGLKRPTRSPRYTAPRVLDTAL